MNLSMWVERHARARPDAIALAHGEHPDATWRDFAARIAAVAGGLTSLHGLAPGDRVILISRVVNAPRDLVFEAFTNPEHLTKFWGPKGFDCTDCKVDLRVGGTFSIVMRGPDGNSYPATGIYDDVRFERHVRTYLRKLAKMTKANEGFEKMLRHQ